MAESVSAQENIIAAIAALLSSLLLGKKIRFFSSLTDQRRFLLEGLSMHSFWLLSLLSLLLSFMRFFLGISRSPLFPSVHLETFSSWSFMARQ